MNPQVVTALALRDFEGIAGPATEVLRVYDTEGNNLSNKFANEQEDLDSEVKGRLVLRPGMYKASTTGRTGSIISLFQTHIGGVMQYLVFYGKSPGRIDFESPYVPQPEPPPIDITLPPTTPSPYVPARTPPDNVPGDITEPPEAQACEEGVTWTVSPTSFDFIMIQGGTLPTPKLGWIQRVGWTTRTSIVRRNHVKDWWVNFRQGYWRWMNGQCKGTLVEAWRYEITDNTLAAGVYADTETLISADGLASSVAVNLTVMPSVVYLAGTVYQFYPSPPYEVPGGHWSATSGDPPTSAQTWTVGVPADPANWRDGKVWQGPGGNFFGYHLTNGWTYHEGGGGDALLWNVQFTNDAGGHFTMTCWWAPGPWYGSTYPWKIKDIPWDQWSDDDKKTLPNPFPGAPPAHA